MLDYAPVSAAHHINKLIMSHEACGDQQQMRLRNPLEHKKCTSVLHFLCSSRSTTPPTTVTVYNFYHTHLSIT
jgi:hypothetical protein